ncbi:unnamed protein product [Caenorhabditis auriculariae]|uniref:F-box domain-containing protein n=1 Tax=Caenorhabditis auriculariae TaxID=2777116 RepID=A0A8S1HSF8_9PELO|nr:unnamed protein product [Caenorhabditis auriculariae]
MEGAWPHVLSRLPLEDVVRCRRVCRRWDSYCGHVLRTCRSLDVEAQCGATISDPLAIASVVDQCGRSLQSVTLRVTAKNEKYSVLSSECHVTSQVIRSVCRRATRLRSLRIDRMILTLGAIENFVHLPATLQEISITNCLISCSTYDVNTIIQASLQKLLDKCTRLVTFEITGRGLCFDHFSLDTAVMSRISNSIRNLSISAGNSLKIDELSFLKHKRLESLTLRRSFISAACLPFLVEMADSLQHLDLSWSPNLLDCTLIGQLPNLRSLNLGNNRDGVTDESLDVIAEQCCLLETLSVENCSHLTQRSLQKNSGVSNVDDEVLIKLAMCSQLNFVELNFCRKVTSRGLLTLLRSLRNLERLEVLGIRGYSHQLLLSCNHRVPRSIVCDSSIPTFSFPIPPIPGTASVVSA